ncbi:alpha/beta hydrolase family protein [Grimontia sp. NTOU-MAR1]|uniref:alpha/beta hydrolase family protein n=1 Tax=Grimontia sp. NTOU-MAR1 TaxID=3111011 RepID=UPI002DBE71F7|nr:alpha/beta fold hydrolase [Grimontia sp. NTOU-MAR1]WRV97740.1 alpha/beta fold hydrolase [Grimontia sp. NTOU-MAR1]
MKPIYLLVILLTFVLNSAFAANVGFEQFSLEDDTSRPLNVSIWYPTVQPSPKTVVGENPAFVGTEVIKAATLDVRKAPVVLLSHGYRGSWRNLNWLATKLAKRGYVVAAPDHPGTTTFDRSPKQAAQWWQRPRDISRVLSFLLNDTKRKHALDAENISAIGHSLGGWTAMQLAGVEFDRHTMKQQCQLVFNQRTCGSAKELGLTDIQPKEPLASSLKDTRIKRVVSLDLGLARGFSVQSMTRTQTPALILAAGIDIGDLPQAMESGYLAEHLPLETRHYKVYEQATHFSFMQRCKAGAVDLLEKEYKGDGIICKDGFGISREKLHARIFKDILWFLE